MPLAQIDAGDLYYEVVGEGPPLLLIAGFSGNTTGWLPVQPALAEHFTLIMFDNRGAGRSCVPPGPYTTRRWRMTPWRSWITLVWSGRTSSAVPWAA